MSKAAAKWWKDIVASERCVICGADAELHHPREGQGMGQRASDFTVIPLCPTHHRLGTEFVAPSLHGAPQKFRTKYGDEWSLLEQTLERVLTRVYESMR